MKEVDGFVSTSDLVDRFVDVDEYYHHEPWNLRQIIANIDILIPVKKKDLIGDNWIPIEERLPDSGNKELHDMNLVTLEDGEVCLGVYRNDENEWLTRRQEGETFYTKKHNVIAWQPLPAPYKPKKQN